MICYVPYIYIWNTLYVMDNSWTVAYIEKVIYSDRVRKKDRKKCDNAELLVAINPTFW